MKTHDEMIDDWKKDPEFCREYDTLEEDFRIADVLLRARHRAGLTQADVAKRMGTKAPAIARIESSGNQRHSPSLRTLRRYAEAVDCRLEVKLVSRKTSPAQDCRGSEGAQP